MRLLFSETLLFTIDLNFFISPGYSSSKGAVLRLTIIVIVFSDGETNSFLACGKLKTDTMFFISTISVARISDSISDNILISISLNFALFFV